MNLNTWYTVATSSLSDQAIYFLPLSRCKNGNFAGTFVTVDLDRPRAKARAKKNTVDLVWARSWKPVPTAELPEKVLAAVQKNQPVTA